MPEEAECLVTPESFAEKQAKRQQAKGMTELVGGFRVSGLGFRVQGLGFMV